jgi:hypothetical protein
LRAKGANIVFCPTRQDIGGVVEDLGVSVIPEIMLEADMSDVDGMSPDLMVEEIQRLRERENTLLYTLNTMLEEKKLQAVGLPPSFVFPTICSWECEFIEQKIK